MNQIEISEEDVKKAGWALENIQTHTIENLAKGIDTIVEIATKYNLDVEELLIACTDFGELIWTH